MSLDSVTEYALSFSGDAVHLLSRSAQLSAAEARVPGWRHLGSVDFETAGFRDALNQLRCMATGAGPDTELPLTLVIPDDQILYTTLTVAASVDRERAVGQALDGLTPYPIGELSFDWHGDGDSVRVAAVARQTLREARDFAAEYGFRGVGYCADPQEGQFPGEPVFVLDAPQRSRAAVAPVGAAAIPVAADAVLAAAGPVDEIPAKAVTEALAKPQTGADAAEAAEDAESAALEAATAPEDLALPADDPGASAPADAAAPENEDKAEPASDPDAEPTEAKVDAGVPEAEVEAPAEAAAETVTESAAETPTTETPVAEADEATKDAPAEPAVAKPAAAAPVVRHAPARPGTPKVAPRVEALNPRARALHDRAAEARQQREEPAGFGMAERPGASGHRGGLASLLGMLALLVVGLVLIWAFAVPGDRPAQVVAVDDAAPASATAPAADSVPQTTAAPEAAETVEPAPAAVPETQTQTDTPVTDPATGESSVPADTQLAAADDTIPDDGPMPQVKAVEEPVSALTEAEQRRVVIAAAAVAAAVVPPHAPGAVAPAHPVTTGTATDAATAPLLATRPNQAPAARNTTPAANVPVATSAPTRAPASNAGNAATGGRGQSAPSRAAINAAVQEANGVGADTLTRSARPGLSPRRSTPTTSVPRADSAPQLPGAAPASTGKASGARPPARRAAAAGAGAAATTPAAAPQAKRPPQRPEGSVPDTLGDQLLDAGEQRQLDGLILDLRRHGLAMAAPGTPQRLADARPSRKPRHEATASDAVSSSAVEAALKSATTPPPNKGAETSSAAAKPARDSGGLLRGSNRPAARPGSAQASAAKSDGGKAEAKADSKAEAKSGGKTAGGAGLSAAAVEEAIAAAVDASPATPGGVQLSSLRSSPLPPRRSDAGPASAAAPAVSLAASPRSPSAILPEAPAATPEPPAAAATAPGPSEAEIAARRALDEQLQAQAEARIRARAAADAAAEAQARAQAEARARAQAAAEERAALANRQTYKPPEIDDEPELAGAGARGGVTAANVARSATQSRGIDMRRTTIIGIIGAGQASRALIRLRSGKVVTVRLGDRIDGGTINSIGDGRLTYVKAGQVRELRMLDGR
ncbi:hypothetical protein GL279_16755 [Paracoccus limosus]|uniref:Translation initiation factor 2 n=1 Tax=Paracoccus limosus TaxID=913252 RepID=A0A844H5H6_9RHOB|nr:hypothetical protein [Paracoccus limosus]MTH36249.1 hypothetical protein [Paracoccus limosus]